MASLATPMGAGPSWPHTNPPNLGVGHRSFHYGSWKVKVKTQCLQQNSSSTVDLLAHCLDILSQCPQIDLRRSELIVQGDNAYKGMQEQHDSAFLELVCGCSETGPGGAPDAPVRPLTRRRGSIFFDAVWSPPFRKQSPRAC